jgi:endonuclease YncB( thermonuclease family)
MHLYTHDNKSAAFGMPSQKYNTEAKAWLTRRLLHRPVTFQLHRRDHYQRLVCTVHDRHWLFPFVRRNVALDMLKAGWAVVYDAAGAVYNGQEAAFREAERVARRKGVGMWRKGGEKTFVHPAEHKRMYLREKSGDTAGEKGKEKT